MSFDYSTDYPHDAYVLSNLETDKAEIILYDLKRKKTIKKIFSNDKYDAGGIGLSKKNNYAIDYLSYEGEKNILIPVSDAYKKLDKENYKSLNRLCRSGACLPRTSGQVQKSSLHTTPPMNHT